MECGKFATDPRHLLHKAAEGANLDKIPGLIVSFGKAACTALCSGRSGGLVIF
jgi:hypothetical protein